MKQVHWFLPLLVGGGMASGALLGMMMVSDAALQDGPAGDLAGAFGALMITMCLLVGFALAAVTLVVRHLLKRPAPGRLLLRFALSVAGGVLVGVTGSSSLVSERTMLSWFLIVGVPILASWSWRPRPA